MKYGGEVAFISTDVYYGSYLEVAMPSQIEFSKTVEGYAAPAESPRLGNGGPLRTPAHRNAQLASRI